jgi:hypothetical protein
MKSTTSALKCVVQYLFCLFSTEQGALDSCSHDKGNGFHSVPQNTVILGRGKWGQEKWKFVFIIL